MYADSCIIIASMHSIRTRALRAHRNEIKTQHDETKYEVDYITLSSGCCALSINRFSSSFNLSLDSSLTQPAG